MKASYTQVLSTAKGNLGFRSIGSDGFRVRVEPTTTGLKFPPTWKKPDGYDNRFSVVVSSIAELGKALAGAAVTLTGTVSSTAASQLGSISTYLGYAQNAVKAAQASL